ncbi:MAG: ATP-binding protein [Chloroflexi bacterium]|nr:ATP-binding protein [Chloroflexota bacterium]MBU1747886.1 ATP-binding protein [Chloroflexota bacterium]MBU1879134.1 ATP-binding protein [Chloroflexota bacterium]
MRVGVEEVVVDPSRQRAVELHIPSELGYEKIAMSAADSLAHKMGFSADRIEDLRTALAEACINAIEHGNRLDADARVLVVLTADVARLQINVRDQGEQPLPGDQPTPSIQDRLAGEIPTRGWGLFLIHQLVDEVTFTSVPGGGNEVRMVIHLEKTAG